MPRGLLFERRETDPVVVPRVYRATSSSCIPYFRMYVRRALMHGASASRGGATFFFSRRTLVDSLSRVEQPFSHLGLAFFSLVARAPGASTFRISRRDTEALFSPVPPHSRAIAQIGNPRAYRGTESERNAHLHPDSNVHSYLRKLLIASSRGEEAS